MRRLTRPQWALACLVALGFALVAATLTSASNSINDTRHDFCSFVAVHYRASLTLPRTAARVTDEQSDRQLLTQLGCH